MTKKTEFLQKLKNLLEEYDVSISFSVSDCSDTYGLSDEKLVFNHRTNKATLEDETWFYVDGWTCTSRDLPPKRQKSAANAREMLPEYYSGSCEEVAKAVDREMALRGRVEQLEAENKLLRKALFDQLNDCINFDGGKLTTCIMEASTAVLAATEPKP